MTFLSVENSHSMDLVLSFEEETHTYTVVSSPPGKECELHDVPTSVTGFLKQYFTPFDAKAVAMAGVEKWGRTPASKYWVIVDMHRNLHDMSDREIALEICAYWDSLGAKASEKGKIMHKDLEVFVEERQDYSLADDNVPYSIALFHEWFQDFFPGQSLKPWRTEWKVVLTTKTDEGRYAPVVAGTIDLVLRGEDGRFWLVDYKRIDPARKGLLGPNGPPPGTKNAKAPFEEWTNDDFTKYSAQLHVYEHIIEHGGYEVDGEPMNVAGLYLLQMHESMTRAHCVEAKNMESEVAEAMRLECAKTCQRYRKTTGPKVQRVA